jgi:hypothetical protein
MKPQHNSVSAQFYPIPSHLFRIFIQPFPLSIHQSFPIVSLRHYDKQLCKRLLGYAAAWQGGTLSSAARGIEPPEFIMLSGRSKYAGVAGTSGAHSS